MTSNHRFFKKLIFSLPYPLQIPTYAFLKIPSNYNTATVPNAPRAPHHLPHILPSHDHPFPFCPAPKSRDHTAGR